MGAEHRSQFAHPGDMDWHKESHNEDDGLPEEIHTVDQHEGRSLQPGSCDDPGMQVGSLPPLPPPDSAPHCPIAARRAIGPSEQEFTFTVHREWLGTMPPAQFAALKADLKYMAIKHCLAKAEVVNSGCNTCIELAASSTAQLQEAKQELCEGQGLLDFHEGEIYRIASESEAGVTYPSLDAAAQTSKRDNANTALAAIREIRTDPEDGVARTFEDARALYIDEFSLTEIKEYWETMPLAR